MIITILRASGGLSISDGSEQKILGCEANTGFHVSVFSRKIFGSLHVPTYVNTLKKCKNQKKKEKERTPIFPGTKGKYYNSLLLPSFFFSSQNEENLLLVFFFINCVGITFRLYPLLFL